MSIRTLVAADAAAFHALRLRGLLECPQAFASSYEEEAGTALVEIERRLQPRPDAALLGAFQEGVLVGMVGLQREGMAKMAHRAHLWGVYVAPEVRAQGLGAALVTTALKHATDTWASRRVTLGVNVRNTAALALYRKLGFVEYGLEQEYLLVDGEFHDEVLMTCPLAGPGQSISIPMHAR
jgi:ribosomal protein S18 acetylase RimI-like enzyme